MDAGIWLGIVGVVITSMGLLQSWYYRTHPRAEVNQERTQSQSRTRQTKNWFSNLFHSFIIPLMVIALSLTSLILKLRDTSPITRMAIFTIALDIGLIFFQTLYTLLITWVDRIYKRFDEVISLQDRELKVVERITAMTSMLDNIDREET